MAGRTVRIGAGAGFAGDRIEPAVELAEHGGIAYLVFECLAERTIALAQQARLRDPEAGFDPLLEDRMRAVLGICRARGIRVITNMGAANPVAAAARVVRVCRALGLAGVKVAAVTGDDVLGVVRDGDWALDQDGGAVRTLGNRIISANAYTGVAPIVASLRDGADVVVTGRAADPAMFLAALVHEFGWAMDDWSRLGRGTLVGHLLECAAQVTGGYFADPGVKDVPDLARIGFPFADVDADGNAEIGKVAGSGGMVSEATVKEQLLYEVHDPARYLQPDVVADFSAVRVTQAGPDRVRIEGGQGHQRTGTLKVSVGCLEGFVGEGQISYAGPGAVARGRLALAIVEERFRLTGLGVSEARFDLIGLDSILGPAPEGTAAREVRARIAGRTATMADAVRIGNEVESLYLNGPAGGGGVTKSARELVGIRSILLPRDLVGGSVTMLES